MGYNPWSRKESDMTEQLNNNKKPSKPKIFTVSFCLLLLLLLSRFSRV